MTEFCDRAWGRIETLRQAVLDHPFNRELAEGTLSRERFRFYLAQDSRYLVAFARALAVAAARATEPDDVAFFAGAARDAVVVERELHESYFARFGVSESDLDAIETSPTCLAYTSYLLATAMTGEYAELVAALLPCFWLYQHVGTSILERRAVPGNPYQAWIDTYADDEFAEAVLGCRNAADRAARTGDEGRMLAAFVRASEYEWLFWDSAYRLESWATTPLRG